MESVLSFWLSWIVQFWNYDLFQYFWYIFYFVFIWYLIKRFIHI